MIAASKAGTMTREAVGDLEQRVGRKRLYLIAGLVGLVLLFFLFRAFVSEPKKPAERPPRPVSVARVVTRDVPLYLDEIGTCAAFASVQVQAQVDGRILERHVQDGAEVKKGDLLFTIDPRPYEAALAAAKADLMLGEANLKRQTTLQEKDVSARQELDTARASAMRAEAAVAAAQVNLDYCYIRSPIDGRVGLRNVDAGNIVSPNSPALVAVQTLDPIYTDFSIAEPDVPLVRRYLGGANLKVVTDAEGDDVPPRTGDLYFIDNAVEPGAGTVKARAVTPNPDRALWPAQFVQVRLILDQLKAAKLVPNGAVQIGQNGPYVFVVKADSTLELRPVTPGQKQDDNLTVIEKGLEPGETVVVRGQLQLAPGTKVIVKEEEESPAPDDSKAVR